MTNTTLKRKNEKKTVFNLVFHTVCFARDNIYFFKLSQIQFP